MKKIIIFSRYIGYNVGGAEKSVLSYAIKKTKNKIGLISLNNRNKKAIKLSSLLYHNIIKTKYNFNRFFIVEYFLNKKKIIKYINDLDKDYIISYGVNYPVLNSLNEKILYEIHIRSEFDLGIFKNYYSGYKRFLKYLYTIIEYPFFYFYKIELKSTLINAQQVITPSHFLKKLLYENYKIESKVIFPEIELNIENFKSSKEYIVFVGDERIKGTHIVKYLAKKLPKQKFKIYSRKIDETFVNKNITYIQWQDSIYNVFNTAKIVLIPSQCGEGYSRIAKESSLLGIPALGSNHGGIPEALEFKGENLVNKYWCKKTWLKELKIKLSIIE